jgi:hypothetical protein
MKAFFKQFVDLISHACSAYAKECARNYELGVYDDHGWW